MGQSKMNRLGKACHFGTTYAEPHPIEPEIDLSYDRLDCHACQGKKHPAARFVTVGGIRLKWASSSSRSIPTHQSPSSRADGPLSNMQMFDSAWRRSLFIGNEILKEIETVSIPWISRSRLSHWIGRQTHYLVAKASEFDWLHRLVRA